MLTNCTKKNREIQLFLLSFCPFFFSGARILDDQLCVNESSDHHYINCQIEPEHQENNARDAAIHQIVIRLIGNEVRQAVGNEDPAYRGQRGGKQRMTEVAALPFP